MIRSEAISAAVAKLRSPVFLARIADEGRGDRGRPTIALHTTDRRGRATLKRHATAELRLAGIEADCRVVTHRAAMLEREASIETLSRSFGSGDIVYDPTGIVGRSGTLVRCAARLKTGMGDRLSGLYLHAERRTLFVILDQRKFAEQPELLLTERVAAMAKITDLIGEWRDEERPDFDVAVRIGFELPEGIALVALDRRSAARRLRQRFAARWRRSGLVAALTSLVGLGAAVPASAADIVRRPVPVVPVSQPAVARHNLDVLLAGAWLDGDGFSNNTWGAVGAKLAVPLHSQWGLQVDAAVGTQDYSGIGGHVFWRDPAVGLFGFLASTESMNGARLTRYAVEGELYYGAMTFRGIAGGQSGVTDSPFARLDVLFYVHPNFEVSLGGEFSSGHNLARVGLELQPSTLSHLSSMSIFADGEIGENGFAKALAGVSFHFGSQGVSLIDRDRKYDPFFSLFNTFATAGYSGP